jgi:hypothetical protein
MKKKQEHWRRDEPTFYNFLALERRPVDAPEFLNGLKGALMSRDGKSGSQTYIMEIPPGFKGRTDAKFASLELFVLRGDLSLNGAGTVGASGYVHLPQLCGGGEVTSKAGALAICFWNPNLPAYPFPVTRNLAVNSFAKEWTNSMPGAHGVMHKSLRIPDPVPHPNDEGFDGGPGGYLRFQYIAPQMIADQEHVHHECWEEIILLQGDVLLLNEGQMGIGSVVGHPQEWYHAPFVSRSGALILVHTDGPMGYPWPPREYPQGRCLCEQYLADSRWDIPAEHIDWEDHPIAHQQEASADYQAWRKTQDGAKWGGYETTEKVPYKPGQRGSTTDFRASWTRK